MGKQKAAGITAGGDRLRVAIVSSDRCKPKKCNHECRKSCPVVKTGKQCIQIPNVRSQPIQNADGTATIPAPSVAIIYEELCIGCGICVKKCPFEAITIINLPKDLSSDTMHRFGQNSFKLHRLPIPKPGQVLGLVGCNGIGKSTALKILCGKLKPNLGLWENPPEWQEILVSFRGNELHAYFTKMLEGKLKAGIKPQYVDYIPKHAKGTVQQTLNQKSEIDNIDYYIDMLELGSVMDRDISALSGGELQRFAISLVCMLNRQVYLIDEPSSYLDVKQRLNAARAIRNLAKSETYVIVVEHDLSVLDYLSDYICCFWGEAGAYGVSTHPFSVREGINVFLDGFIPTENLRFRRESLSFRVIRDDDDAEIVRGGLHSFPYPEMKKKLGDFELKIDKGAFNQSEIIVLLGQNGTGKSTFIRILAGLLEPDESAESATTAKRNKLSISYKPQTITARFKGTVRQLFVTKLGQRFMDSLFQNEVVRPMQIDHLLDDDVVNLSGGELQRVAIILVLGKGADIYLIDEPSAYLDSEQRINAARIIKRFILNSKKTAFIVEHDFTMATYLADRVIVYEGNPGLSCTARSPERLVSGMNRFLASIEITFRRDLSNFRPRINKLDSLKDREQKLSGDYFLLED